MHHLEHRLWERDFSLRTERPFDWGLEHLDIPENGGGPLADLKRFTSETIGSSQSFFAPAPSDANDFTFDGHTLRFPSALTSPYEQNNSCVGRYFPAGNDDRAVIISPHWNAPRDGYVALARGLNRVGVSALRLSLPYHDQRMPEGLTRADYMVSANVGLTIQAVRQAVLDIRRAADWLVRRGINRIGLTGTSIGSCVSWLAFVHDKRFDAGAFNLVSSYFGDVVWRGLTTSHVRKGLETAMTAAEVREAWLVISPSVYTKLLKGDKRKLLMISARYDLTFLPDLSQILFDDCHAHGIEPRKVLLRCGHYTIGRTPFKYIDGFHLVNFFRGL
jgi:hypothetical protein